MGLSDANGDNDISRHETHSHLLRGADASRLCWNTHTIGLNIESESVLIPTIWMWVQEEERKVKGKLGEAKRCTYDVWMPLCGPDMCLKG